MHWDSHCTAVYAEWVVRLLHPRRAPWKEIVRAWYPEWNKLEEGIFVADSNDRQKILSHIPPNAAYLRTCIIEFNKLDLNQLTSIKDATMLAEPLWLNFRFDINLPVKRIALWIKHLKVMHVRDLFDSNTDALFTTSDWHQFFQRHLPQRNPQRLEGDLDNITAQLPSDLESTCAIPAPSQMQPNTIVALLVPGSLP